MATELYNEIIGYYSPYFYSIATCLVAIASHYSRGFNLKTRTEILGKQGNKCLFCGQELTLNHANRPESDNTQIGQAHHKIPYREINNYNINRKPKDKVDPNLKNNCAILCPHCHKIADKLTELELYINPRLHPQTFIQEFKKLLMFCSKYFEDGNLETLEKIKELIYMLFIILHDTNTELSNLTNLISNNSLPAFVFPIPDTAKKQTMEFIEENLIVILDLIIQCQIQS
ncbi:MAG: hypothetical protein KatS3mg090_0887 [Patescibacteria group bacterium]|nr:MAG: hypothetical protein KatS3mg090_0887 [Patescibacteria group bacterium]